MVSPDVTPKRRLRLAIVTNIPVPYRIPVYDLIAVDARFDFLALYAAPREPDRHWQLPLLQHAHHFLQPGMVERHGRFIHNNPDVGRQLRQFNPHVVLTTGFNPTHLRAWAHTLWHRCRHVAMTDGTDVSEAGLSPLHKVVRRLVFSSTSAFVAASQGGRRLLHSYGVPDRLIFQSPLCANMAVDWRSGAGTEKDIDLLFSARLVPAKNPAFALTIAHAAARQLGRRLQLAVMGSGPQEQELREQAARLADHLDVRFAGHVAQSDVPGWFHRAKLFLLPSSFEPWGVVANEACLAGVPVLTSPFAGVAEELVRDGETGRVLPLDVQAWATAASQILEDPALHRRLSLAARRRVMHYNFENAARGIMDAALATWTPPGSPSSGNAVE